VCHCLKSGWCTPAVWGRVCSEAGGGAASALGQGSLWMQAAVPELPVRLIAERSGWPAEVDGGCWCGAVVCSAGWEPKNDFWRLSPNCHGRELGCVRPELHMAGSGEAEWDLRACEKDVHLSPCKAILK